jgi:hypothetical protein
MSDAIVAELVRELSPILIPIAVSAVGAAVSIGFSAVSRWSGGKIAANAAFEAKVRDAAATEAGALVAAAADNLATKQIKIGDPMLEQSISNVVAAIPELQAMSGWSNAKISGLVVGEIGKLQAAVTAAAPARAAK